MTDKKKDIMEELKTLSGRADALDGLDALDELDALFGDPMEQSGGMPDPNFGGMPGIAGFSMPGMPKDIALYDRVIVHGLRADYELTFEETEDGLVINVADKR